ncbi:hypothetical protein ES288_A13G192600v1 [Gossypium darwinii]|uniref:Uncharacterized protein n=2 Tax=Gossypium TaxID=3633 RepID=A0A5D2MN73_GOSTO|nr:hypothetical protein ES288_A13G192600v1 [Gossypium darwinii]TYH92648.1 hypothetical protein ES332_A13G196200v1 [Gossypium tomentosum]
MDATHWDLAWETVPLVPFQCIPGAATKILFLLGSFGFGLDLGYEFIRIGF